MLKLFKVFLRNFYIFKLTESCGNAVNDLICFYPFLNYRSGAFYFSLCTRRNRYFMVIINYFFGKAVVQVFTVYWYFLHIYKYN